MRTDKSIKNAIVAVVSNTLLIIIGFVSQAVFKNCLGQEYLGLNGLLTSVVSMLGIVELGLGTALIYHLYKPVAENDTERILALMRLYRISYRIIAAIILCAGFALMPFLHFFISTDLDVNIYYIFGLFIIESSFSYLLSYKRSILYANQENYIVNAIHIAYLLALNISQIAILINTRDYVLYLWLKIIFRIIENIAVTIVANIRYPYLKTKSKTKVDSDTVNDIFIKVKGLFIHRIGSYLVLGTDNLIISKFLNLEIVGRYTSYTMITAGIKNLFSQVFYSITASVGNLLVLDKDKAFAVYKNMLFMNFWLSCFCSISFYIISKPFVILWLGSDIVLSNIIVFAMMINLYFDTYGFTIGAFKSAAGIFHEDRWIPALQSLINIVISVLLVRIWGLTGVIIGTIASQMILYIFSYPHFVYKKLFEKDKFDYYYETFKYAVVFTIAFFITALVSQYLDNLIENVVTQFFTNVIICAIVPNLVLLAIFYKRSEFKYYIVLVKQVILRIFKRR